MPLHFGPLRFFFIREEIFSSSLDTLVLSAGVEVTLGDQCRAKVRSISENSKEVQAD
ncbi:unnamed protein product [Amoebophrya sp. A25]|nr:unnamed protein product [Amoebophrya sp. A25]|eukprot:GSA25T00014882001.1